MLLDFLVVCRISVISPLLGVRHPVNSLLNATQSCRNCEKLLFNCIATLVIIILSCLHVEPSLVYIRMIGGVNGFAANAV